ncbi:MAG: hypothetical protein U1A78_16610 [Polyangia bacterium]
MAQADGGKRRTTALAFSPQAQWIAAGQDDGSVHIWRTEGRQTESTCRVKGLPATVIGRPVSAMVITPSGNLFSVTSRNETVHACYGALEAASGAQPDSLVASRMLPALARVPSSLFERAAFDAHGEHLAIATNRALGVWSVRDGEPKWTRGPLTSLVMAMTVSPDGRLLATGALNGGISIWNMQTGEEHRLTSNHAKTVRALIFSPDSRLLAAGAEDSSISLWDTRSMRHVGGLQQNMPVTALAFHPDGAVLAAASDDSVISLWEVTTGTALRALRSNADPIRAVALNPSGTLLATGSDDQQVRIWKRNTEGKSGPAWSPSCSPEAMRTGVVRSLAFRPGNDKLLAVATDSTSIRLLDVEACVWGEPLETSTDWAASVAFSPDGRILASGMEDGAVLLWDVETRRKRTLLGHRDEVHALAFQDVPRGLLATASFDKTVRLWDVASGQLVGQLPPQVEGIRAVDFSPDGQILAMASGREASLWKLESAVVLGKREEHPILLGKMPHEQRVTAVRFTPDGQRLATSCADGQARLFDVASRQPWAELGGESERAPAMALALAERSGLLAAAALGRVHLWLLEDPNQYAQLWQSGQGWGVWSTAGRLYRHDPGGLLWQRDTDGTLTPVPPPVPELPPQLQIEIPEEPKNPGERHMVRLTARIRNLAGGPAYWVRVEGSDLAERRDLRDSLLLLPSTQRMRLDPGESVDVPVQVSLRERPWFPAYRRFCLTLRHEHVNQGMGQCAGALAHEVVLDVGPYSWLLVVELVALLATVGLAMFLGVRLAHRREVLSHPVLHELLSGQNPLRDLPLLELPGADAALRRAEEFYKGLRRRALDDAGIDDIGWDRAISVLKSPELCANHFVESLLTKLDSPMAPFYKTADIQAFRITLPPLSIYVPVDTILVVCTSTTMTPQSAVSRSKPEELEWPRFVILIDLSTAQPESTEVRQALRDAHPGTVFVVLQPAALKHILLARDARQAKEALRAAIVDQCELRHIVPYRKGGNEIRPEEECFFFGRQVELERMLNRHRSNFVLVGPRLMGKSSLLNALTRELARRYPRVRVLKHQLFDDSLKSIQSVDPSVRADSPEALFESVMQRTTEHQIFLFDEADKFIEKENRTQHLFCSVMRALHGQGRASFILAGHQELHEATRAPDHPLRNFGEVIRLEPLDPDSAERMIIDPLTAVGLRFASESAVVDWLREQTGCRPHLLAQLCWALVSMRKPLSPMAILLEEVQEEVRSLRNLRLAFDAWENGRVDPLDRALLRSALLLNRPLLQAVCEFLKGRGIRPTDAAIARSLSRLYAWHYLLIPDHQGRLFCPVPLFQYWISDPGLRAPRAHAWSSARDRIESELERDLDELRSRESAAPTAG